MSSGLIKVAVPTDSEAIEYLKSGEPGELKISPLKAKSMYPDKIKSHQHFKCPTEGCEAPITCRSIRVSNVNQPAFVNQHRSGMAHAEFCRFHPDNHEKSEVSSEPAERLSAHYANGNTYSGLTIQKGFLPMKKATGSAPPPQTEEIVQAGTAKVSESKGNATQQKKISHHLNTLQIHVEMFIDDPEFEVLLHHSNKRIPIKYMFKNIYRNVLYKDLPQKSYLEIYKDKAFLSETSSDKVLAIRFWTKVRIDGKDYRPSMIISREYFESEYGDLYDDFIAGKKLEFDVYTTLPFRLNGPYLNFSSYASDTGVFPFGEEIKSNFYIR